MKVWLLFEEIEKVKSFILTINKGGAMDKKRVLDFYLRGFL